MQLATLLSRVCLGRRFAEVKRMLCLPNHMVVGQYGFSSIWEANHHLRHVPREAVLWASENKWPLAAPVCASEPGFGKGSRWQTSAKIYFSRLFAADCCYRAEEIADVQCLLFKPPISTEKKKGPINSQQNFIVTYCDCLWKLLCWY